MQKIAVRTKTAQEIIMDLGQQVSTLIHQVVAGNPVWRFLAALLVLVFGFGGLEIVLRYLRRRFQASLDLKRLSAIGMETGAFLAPLRLACSALLLRLSEAFLILPASLNRLLHGVEELLLALAIILLMFKLVNLLDHLQPSLPRQLQEEFTEKTLPKIKTLLRIAILFGAVFFFAVAQRALFPRWVWQYALWRYFFVLGLAVLIFYVARLIDRFLFTMIASFRGVEEKTRTRLVLRAVIWPVRLFLVNIWLFALQGLLPLPESANRLAEGAMGLLTTVALVVFIYRLLDVAVHEITKIAQREESLLDQTFVHLVRIVARVVILSLGAIYIFRALSGKPMSTLLAGLGIGGLAVALAAQDTLKNFFGSIMIMLDKPFSVGQRVTVDGFDGMVEDIGFRSTRVRTLTGHLVTIPNEKMASASIENIGQRPSIRRLTNITITYDTPPDKVEHAVAIIREILDNHEGMHPDFPPRVYFNEFNDTSLNIMMIYWYFPANYWDFCALSERVNLEIMRAFEAEGIEFAFPTTTTYLAHDQKRPLHLQLSGDKALFTLKTGPQKAGES